MNERLVLLASLYLTVAVALLHTSLAQTPLLQVTYNFGGMPEKVSLECEFDGILRSGATYTFRDPEGRVENIVDAPGRSYEFTIHPTNESLITCTFNNVESERVKVVAIPRDNTPGVKIVNQYVYSDSAVADVVCPFELGRLRELYEISWSTAGSQGNRVGPATNGVYWLEEEDNRTLHVNISTPGPLRYQCAGEVQTCRRHTLMCETFSTPSPTFVVMPIDRLSVTEPVSVTVDQYESATFNCTATGSGDLIIEWNCSDGSSCDMSSTNSRDDKLVTSTLVVTGATSNLTVTCNVTQNLTNLTSGESASIEVRRPSDFVSIKRVQRTAQLIFMPVPTTAPSTDPPTGASSPSGPSSLSGQETIIILTLVLVFIITVIVILASCICCIFRYHYRNKESQLGQKLRRTFSRDPEAILQRYRPRESSPRQLDVEIQGTDTPPITCTAPDSAYVANGNNHLALTGDQIYNTSQISGASGASSYSGMSGVSQNHGPHRMPRFGDPSHLGLPSGANYPDHHSMNSRRASDTSGSIHSGYSNGHQVPYYPTAIHSSHNVINHQPHASHPDSTSLPGFQFIPSRYSTLPHVQQQQHTDPLSSLPVLTHPSGAYVVYPQHATSQPIQPLHSERANSTLSSHSGNSHKGSGRQSPASVSQHIQHPSPHMQPIPVYQPALQSHFISPTDLAVVQFALMHNRHCQIPGCCCQRVRELVEGNRGRMPYDSPEMSVSSSGSEKGSRVHRVNHQASSTDSDSDYSSYNDRRSRPPNLRLLSDEHNRNPNLHPHYHLTTKSHMRRISIHAPVDHRRSKSLSDLTPLTEVPETPAKTPAIGGSVKAGTPVYYCPPIIGEDGQEKPTSPVDCRCTNQPMLLREISISADNIPALCLNDCPFTPSPLKEGCHMLAGAPGRRSFRRASMRSTKPKLKTVKEKSSSGESDDSNTSSRSNTPIKSSQSDDEGIDVQSHHSQELKSSSLHKHTKIPTDTTLTNKAPVDTAHQTLIDSAPKSSLGMESSHYDRSLDDEVKEIMQSAPARDIQKTAPSRSPLLGRKRNESTNSGYLLSNSNVMSDPRMRRSVSPLSIGSSSQVSVHSRRSTSPYETEIRKQNGIVTETTEC